MKRILVFLLLVLISFNLFAFSSRIGDLNARLYSTDSSPSFFGSINDIYYNAASLPLIEDGKMVQLSLSFGEKYNPSIFGEKSPYIQNGESEVHAVVVAGPLALSLKFSSLSTDRTLYSDIPHFNMLSSVDLELDLGFSFLKYFSVGLSLSGGNSVIRRDKKITNPLEWVQNAYFSSYENTTGYDRFNTSFGFIVHNDNFSLSLHINDLTDLTDNFYSSFMNILSNSSVSLSYRGNKYTKKGDLVLFLPRVSLSFSGLGERNDRVFMAQCDVTFQALKDTKLNFGVKYTRLMKENNDENIISFSLSGFLGKHSLEINFAYAFQSKESIIPSLVYSFSF